MIGCLVMTVTRNETDTRRRALTWSRRGFVYRVLVPDPVGLPSVVLICKGYWSVFGGRLSLMAVLGSIKLPAALEYIKTKRMKNLLSN